LKVEHGRSNLASMGIDWNHSIFEARRETAIVVDVFKKE
jgi:hypothetical protein